VKCDSEIPFQCKVMVGGSQLSALKTQYHRLGNTDQTNYW